MTRKITVVLVASLLCSITMFSACGSAGAVKPSVAVIPQNWYLSDEDEYGYFEEVDGTKWGMIEYTDADDSDFVQIYYGDVPTELKNRESDIDALTGRAVLESTTFDSDEMFSMTISGQPAGCIRGYDETYAVYDMEIVYVYESTCIDIYSEYDATAEDEAQVMSLINSITISQQ